MGGTGLGYEENEKGGGGHAQKQLYEELWTTLKVEEKERERTTGRRLRRMRRE